MVFVLALVALVLIFGVSMYAMEKLVDGYSGFALIGTILAGLGIAVSGVGAIVYFCMVWQWFAAGAKADILEREYGVKYSQSEMFFASNVINVVRELDRKRIEVNGDFRRQRDPERDLPKPDNR